MKGWKNLKILSKKSNLVPLDSLRKNQKNSWTQLFHFGSSWKVTGRIGNPPLELGLTNICWYQFFIFKYKRQIIQNFVLFAKCWTGQCCMLKIAMRLQPKFPSTNDNFILPTGVHISPLSRISSSIWWSFFLDPE